jgi:hypothetical protein
VRGLESGVREFLVTVFVSLFKAREARENSGIVVGVILNMWRC